ncbi:hypothetical protein [Microcella sp.]|uniref:hypothetical protein n=1 Tax=Microcella sp. TaxID=1913979 RepID=UPI00256AD685|nr:hypothetical protein [Microcella sp.]MBX9471281.1 hypothetical protein [Microcella sp.]
MAHDSAQSEDPTSAEQTSEPDLSPADLFYLRVQGLLNTFSLRQAEILRLATYIDERTAEVDSAAARARDRIRQKIGSAPAGSLDHDSVIHQLLEVFKSEPFEDDEDEELSEDERFDAFTSALTEVGDSLPEGLLSTYIEAVIEALETPPGSRFLHPPLLVTLVGELEMVVKSLARASFERQPAALNDEGKTFSWAELIEHESLDDVRDSLVDRVIDDVLRGSLTDWCDYFVKRFKIAKIASVDTLEAQEPVQRRHCIVHNAGMASQPYIERLQAYGHSAELGSSLDVDAQYLRRAADALYLVAYSLCWAVAFKLAQTDEERNNFGSLLANRIYFLLQQGRHQLVIDIVSSAPLERLNEMTAFVVKVNYWIAMKRIGRFSEVRPEIESLDTRARSREFRLAKLALLDRVEEAHELTEQMIRDSELRPEFLFTWPLLTGVRDFAASRTEPDTIAPTEQD